MPISAYIQSVLFVVMIAVALFASAGTIAIPGFWIYVAIYTFVFVLSLVIPDPALLEERMRPGGKRVTQAAQKGQFVPSAVGPSAIEMVANRCITITPQELE